MKKITFANMGNYSPAFRFLFSELGNEVVLPDKNNKKAIEDGVRSSPETICLPFKINMGNYISAFSKGVETVVMFDSEGQCRFRYYGILQEKILNEMGHNVSFIHLSPNNFIREIRKLRSVSLKNSIRAVYQGFKVVKMIEEVEEMARWYRPRESKIGESNLILEEYLKNIDRAEGFSDFKESFKKAKKSFRAIKTQKRNPLKVILIGEIYCTIDPFINQQIERKLGEMGMEAHRNVNLGNFVTHGITRLIRDPIMLFKTRKYISAFVGGHGVHSVGEVIEYTEKGFDGVIHTFPFACMPEITVRPLIQQIGKEKGVPILSLSFDEHSSQTGFQTRIEAFVDLIKNKNQKI